MKTAKQQLSPFVMSAEEYFNTNSEDGSRAQTPEQLDFLTYLSSSVLLFRSTGFTSIENTRLEILEAAIVNNEAVVVGGLAVASADCTFSDSASVGASLFEARAVVGDEAVVGDGVLVKAGIVIGDGVQIGARVEKGAVVDAVNVLENKTTIPTTVHNPRSEQVVGSTGNARSLLSRLRRNR